VKRLIAAVMLIVAFVAVWLFTNLNGQDALPDNTDIFTVKLTVNVSTLLDNFHLLDRNKHELVPIDGVVFPPTYVEAFEGESAFDVLLREMRNAGIHMAFRNTPAFNSAYITAINNIYEFDAGPLSGWKYRVNDNFPGFGVSRHFVEPGDVIELLYTLDLGRDVNGFFEGEDDDD